MQCIPYCVMNTVFMNTCIYNVFVKKNTLDLDLAYFALIVCTAPKVTKY